MCVKLAKIELLEWKKTKAHERPTVKEEVIRVVTNPLGGREGEGGRKGTFVLPWNRWVRRALINFHHTR